MAKVPQEGPLIILSNHINFLEVPLIYLSLYPRPATGLAKQESWKNPLYAFLFNAIDMIAIHRGKVDQNAFRQVDEALESGMMIAVAPEGTRSYNGQMLPGKPGIILLALRSDAPLLPVVHYGGENLRQNLKRLKRTDFRIVVGNPFRVNFEGGRPDRQQRQQITDEIMYQMAALLPPPYRGHYSDLSRASEDYLSFDPGVESNLLQDADETPSVSSQ